MQLRNRRTSATDSDFSDVRGEVRVPLGEWVHVVHTYAKGIEGKIYINGKLDASAKPHPTSSPRAVSIRYGIKQLRFRR